MFFAYAFYFFIRVSKNGHTIYEVIVMLNFIMGSLFGGAVGVFAMCLCVAAKWGDGE